MGNLTPNPLDALAVPQKMPYGVGAPQEPVNQVTTPVVTQPVQQADPVEKTVVVPNVPPPASPVPVEAWESAEKDPKALMGVYASLAAYSRAHPVKVDEDTKPDLTRFDPSESGTPPNHEDYPGGPDEADEQDYNLDLQLWLQYHPANIIFAKSA